MLLSSSRLGAVCLLLPWQCQEMLLMVVMLAEDASSIEGMEVDKSLQSALINKIPNVTNVKATLPFHNQQNTESGVWLKLFHANQEPYSF